MENKIISERDKLPDVFKVILLCHNCGNIWSMRCKKFDTLQDFGSSVSLFYCGELIQCDITCSVCGNRGAVDNSKVNVLYRSPITEVGDKPFHIKEDKSNG